MAVTVITLLALIVAFIFTLQQMYTLPAYTLQLYVSKQWIKATVTATDTSFALPVNMGDPLGALTTWENGAYQTNNLPHPSITSLSTSKIGLITTYGNAVTYVLIYGRSQTVDKQLHGGKCARAKI